MRSALLCALALLLVPAARAFWIIGHQPLVTQRFDAIVSPGGISGHAHAFVGSGAIDSSSTRKSLRGAHAKGACTTTGLRADSSSYWAPQLYRYYRNGTFASVPLAFANTYYLPRDGPTQKKIVAFPPGLRMIGGNAMATAHETQFPAGAHPYSWVCLQTSGPSPQTDEIPHGPCPAGLRAQIIFPSCWDGKNLDSPDHTSHMSYPIGRPDGGDCPATHPVKVPVLFYEWVFAVGSGAGNGRWVLSNGDSVGYSFHGDFLEAWDTRVLQAAIDQCTGNLFGALEKCPPFVESGLDREAASRCTAPNLVHERAVGFNLKALPGCNVIKNGVHTGKGQPSAQCTTPPSFTTRKQDVANRKAQSRGKGVRTRMVHLRTE